MGDEGDLQSCMGRVTILAIYFASPPLAFAKTCIAADQVQGPLYFVRARQVRVRAALPVPAPEPGETLPGMGGPIDIRDDSEDLNVRLLAEYGAVPAAARECDACARERRARACVATGDDDERFLQHPFSSAPYIHPLNYPKYYALQLRAVEWAKQHGRSVNWVVAHDYPLHRDDQDQPIKSSCVHVNRIAY